MDIARAARPLAIHVAVLFGAGLASSVHAQDCCLPEIVEHATWDGSPWNAGALIEADEIGGVHLLYDYGHWSSLHVPSLQTSRDDGRTWSALATPVPSCYQFATAVDASGAVVIVYADADGVWTMTSSDQARTFGAPTALGSAFGDADRCLVTVVASSTGVIVAEWMDSDPNSSPAVGIAVSGDRGLTWQPSTIVPRDEPGYEQLSGPSVAITEQAVVIAWRRKELSSPRGEAVSMRSTDLGLAWSEPTLVTTASVRTIVLSAGGGQHVQALYVTHDDVSDRHDTFVTASPDDGATWPGPDEIISPSGGGSVAGGGPVAKANGEVYVLMRADSGSLQLQSSADHGLPGTWLPTASVVTSDPIEQWTYLGIVATAPGVVDVIHSGGRPDGMGLAIFDAHSCDRGATIPDSRRRLDHDRSMGERCELWGRPVLGRDGRVHMAWNYTNTGLEYVCIKVPERARIAVSQLPGAGCRPPGHRLEVLPGERADCATSTFEWWMDDGLVRGATGQIFDVPDSVGPGRHLFHCVERCDGVVPCRGASTDVAIDVTVPPSSVLGANIDGLLLVAKEGSGVRVSWQDRAPAPTGHSVLAGTLRSLRVDRAYDHAGLECRLPRRPLAATEFSIAAAMPSVDTYFLVAPVDCLWEGLVGSSSLGIERPIVGSGPACGPMPP